MYYVTDLFELAMHRLPVVWLHPADTTLFYHASQCSALHMTKLIPRKQYTAYSILKKPKVYPLTLEATRGVWVPLFSFAFVEEVLRSVELDADLTRRPFWTHQTQKW